MSNYPTLVDLLDELADGAGYLAEDLDAEIVSPRDGDFLGRWARLFETVQEIDVVVAHEVEISLTTDIPSSEGVDENT